MTIISGFIERKNVTSNMQQDEDDKKVLHAQEG
jgi:hypothetical protein